MKHLRVQPDGEKHIRITGIDPVLLDCLHSLPETLEQRDSPAVRDRLFPDLTTDDDDANRDWQQFVAPELHHLFASAGETVVRDLTAMQSDPTHADLLQLTFPAEHLPSWLTAVNQARLILGEVFDVTESDMDDTDFDLKTPKDLALLRIHILGYLLELLVAQTGIQ